MDSINFLPLSLEVKYDSLKIDGMYIVSLIVVKYDNYIYILDTMRQLMETEEVEISFHIKRENNTEILKKLTNIIAESGSEIASISKNQVDINIIDSIKQKAVDLRKKIQVDNEQIYMLSTYIVLKGETLAEVIAKQKKYINNLYTKQIILKPANFRQKEAYIATLPINTNSELISKYTHSVFTEQGLGKLFPFFEADVLNKNGMILGNANNNLCSIDVFDKKNNNYNMCVFGSSGAGKSYFVKLMILKNAYKGIRQIIIDPEGEYVELVKKIGGQVYTIERYNPFEIDEEFTKQEGFFKQKINQVAEYICNIIEFLDIEQVKKCVEKTYNKYGITEDKKSLYTFHDDMKIYIKPQYIKVFPSLYDLYSIMKQENILNEKQFDKLVIRKGVNEINSYTNELYCFHIKGKSADDIKKEMQAFIPKIYELIKGKTLIYFDEVWKTSGYGKDRYVIENIYNMFKTLRKKQAGVIAISQDICDLFTLDDGNLGKSILNNANIKLLFKMQWQDIDMLERIIESTTFSKTIKTLSRGNAYVCMGNTNFNLEIKATEYEHKLIEGEKYEKNINGDE